MSKHHWTLLANMKQLKKYKTNNYRESRQMIGNHTNMEKQTTWWGSRKSKKCALFVVLFLQATEQLRGDSNFLSTISKNHCVFMVCVSCLRRGSFQKNKHKYTHVFFHTFPYHLQNQRCVILFLRHNENMWLLIRWTNTNIKNKLVSLLFNRKIQNKHRLLILLNETYKKKRMCVVLGF